MSIIIGSARKDENGKYVGGKRGDQTTHEVETQEFYVHSKGWYVLRPKKKTVAKKIAEAMLIACANDNIGYNQDDRDAIISVGVNTKTKTNCDCSSLIRACIIYATGKSFPDFYTGDQCLTLEASGLFEQRQEYVNGFKLAVGDVLVTKKKGHTVAVCKVEEEKKEEPVITSRPVIKKGYKDSDGTHYCSNLQASLNYFGYRDSNRNKLDADGSCGNKTIEAIKNAQADLINKGFYTGSVDGACGPLTWSALDSLDKLGYKVKTTTNVNCRQPAIIQSLGKVVRVINQGTTVRISNWNGKWLYAPDADGYISSNCVEKI